MKDLRFYDFEFNLLHIENNYLSVNWAIKHNDIGTFEAHFELISDTVPVVLNNLYLVVVQGTDAAIITGKQCKTELAVYGRTCNWLLSRRTTPKFEQQSGTAEALSNAYVSAAFSDILNHPKGVYLGTAAGLTKTVDFWRNTYNKTSDVVRDCLTLDSAGHEVIFDAMNKRWVFQIRKGVTLPLVVSEDNLNAYDTEYSNDVLDYYSGGWYEQEQPAEDGNVQEPVWTYLSGDTSKTGIYKWVAPLSGTSESDAMTDLRKKKVNDTVTLKTINLVRGVDYNLGDTVRVQIDKEGFKKTIRKRISGVNTWYEGTDIGEQPILEDIEEEES